MNLSEHFTLAEMTRSQTAAKRGIDNVPDDEAMANLKALCVNVLEPIRAHFNKPVTVTSGFRSAELNRMIGSAPNSQHGRGEAADIEIAGVDNDDLYNYITRHLKFDQLIAELLERDDGRAGWIHVSYTKTNRMQQLSYLGKGRGYDVGLKYL